jgi:hypothetical protein
VTADQYEIGAAYGEGRVVLVVTRGRQSKTVGPWEPRQTPVHLAVLEAVERATMLELHQVPRIVFVAQTSVVAVCQRDVPDGWEGLRQRLTEGRFEVRHGEPAARPACLVAARAAVGSVE